MDIRSIIKSLEGCPCGREHTVDIKAVEVGHGMKERCAEILIQNGFPKNILVVADKNTLSASEGIIDILKCGGFSVKLRMYDNFREPLECFVDEIRAACADVEGILSVGTGSLNDICRRASLLCDKEFAIFATAPSMDGFASGTAPIIVNGIKDTLPARQPSIIIGDTEILAASPAHLKAAGFGDIIGKYIALVDWRVANLLVGEYYCDAIASLVREALRRMTAMADRVCADDEETAGFIMETLIFTGIAMKLAECSRPASGAEHQISHFLGMKKLAEGKIADFHGKKVGVATAELCRIYNKIADMDNVSFCKDRTVLSDVYAAYGAEQHEFITKMNYPSICDKIPKTLLSEKFADIQRIIREELPPTEELISVMKLAGAATEYHEIDVDAELAKEAMKYHSYMRCKVVLTRMLTMTDVDITTL
jgi:glycerol-1-phosphate dehydrogenase [NAD(P)+]